MFTAILFTLNQVAIFLGSVLVLEVVEVFSLALTKHVLQYLRYIYNKICLLDPVITYWELIQGLKADFNWLDIRQENRNETLLRNISASPLNVAVICTFCVFLLLSHGAVLPKSMSWHINSLFGCFRLNVSKRLNSLSIPSEIWIWYLFTFPLQHSWTFQS